MLGPNGLGQPLSARILPESIYYNSTYLDSGKLPSYGQLLQYGCWCQLHTQLWEGSNKGVPLDPLDAACRSWSKCYDCQTMDKKTCKGLDNEYGQWFLLLTRRF